MAVIEQIDIVSLLSTLLGWFALIVILALVFGIAIWILRIYFITQLLGGTGPRRQPEVGKQCPYCRGFSPQDSKFCKNCGRQIG